MTDEQVIKRRLLFDGEGTGDDRRINFLQKQIVKWILSDYDSEEQNETMYNTILLQICLIEHSRRKSELIKLQTARQLQQYKDYQKKTEANIADIEETINVSKIVLAKVKCEKHQKLNYDMIAKDIVKQPSRIKTTKSAEQLQSDIDNMKELQQKLKDEFTKWRRNLIVLLTSANQMCLSFNDFSCTQNDHNAI